MAASKKNIQPTQEELDEQELSLLSNEIEEIMSLMQQNHTRDTIKQHISSLRRQIKHDKNESTPYLRIHHTSKSGKICPLQRRSAHLLMLDEAYMKQRQLHKYPRDLNHILNVKVKERLKILSRMTRDYNADLDSDVSE